MKFDFNDEDNDFENAFGKEGADKGKDVWKVNENFKSKYEHNRRREMLEQGKLKYGDLLDDGDESSESESSEIIKLYLKY